VLRDIQHLLSPSALDSLILYKIFILKAEPFAHGITMIKLMKLYAQENIQFSRKNELVCLLVVMLSEKWVKEKHDELVRSYNTEKLVEMVWIL
jgi:hypothetical protein